MSLEIAVKEQLSPELQAKYHGWGEFGVDANKSILLSQQKIELLKQKYPMPTDITAGEAALKQLKRELKVEEENAKKYTKPLNDFIDRINAARKDLYCETTVSGKKHRIGLIAEYEDALLKLKEAEAERVRVANERARYVSNMEQNLRMQMAKKIADNKDWMQANAKIALTIALENNVPFEGIAKFTEKFRIDNQHQHSYVFSPQYDTNDTEICQIANRVIGEYETVNYNDVHTNIFNEVFTGYNHKLADKAKAIAVAAQQVEEARLAHEQELKKAEMQAKLDATVVVHEVAAGKALKRSYKVSNKLTTFESMIKFSSCANAVSEKLKPKLKMPAGGFINLKLTQLAAAFEAIKNEDNEFEVEGITFVEIAKL